MSNKKRIRIPRRRLTDHPILGTCRIEIHRLIAVERLGRKLMKDEIVHHDDRNRRNNEPDNLIVMTKKEHDDLHAVDRAIGTAKHLRGKKLPEHVKRKISLAMMGNKSRTGQKFSAAQCANIALAAAKRQRTLTGQFMPKITAPRAP